MKINMLNSGASTDFPICIPLFDHEWSTDPTGQTVTVTLPVRRTSTNITVRLRVDGGLIVATPQYATISVGANTWETLSISFTAASRSMVSLWLEVWATDAVSSVYIDTEAISITKA
jgi:hypothetical protein